MHTENTILNEDWETSHVCYYRIAGITLRVESDLPITDSTFHTKFKLFQVDGPGEDNISLRHHFSLPNLDRWDLGKEIYRKPPWAIYKKDDSWAYLGISSIPENKHVHQFALFNYDHTKGSVYNRWEKTFLEGNLHSLTLFPTDQILLARVLADRGGCYFHSSGMTLDGEGILFLGHSGSGKSTVATIMRDRANILCDDRMIVRRWEDGFRIHGNWSHGDISEVSANSASLRAIMFIQQAKENQLIPIDNKPKTIRKLLSCLIRPLITSDWWEKMLTLVGKIACEVPCYHLYFDRSGKIVDILADEFIFRKDH